MMKRWWWLTLEERQKKLRKMMEKEPTPRERNKRNPYRRGAKAYLASFDVGELREFKEALNYDNLRSIACHMKKDYGCAFTFQTVGVKRYITRVK